jgi:hypothetical protein
MNPSLARIGILMRIETPCNVRKRQHQYPEFGHTQGEIQKHLQKSTLAFNWGWNSENHQFWWFLSFTLSFFFPDHLHWCYIDFQYSYLYISTIIPLEPCALNAGIQRFVLSFSISYWDSIKFPNIRNTTKRGVRGWKEAQRQVNWRISLMWPKVQHIFGELGTRTNHE